MIKPRVFLCNGTQLEDVKKDLKDSVIVRLNSYGKDTNVNIQLRDVSKVILKHLQPRLVDFLEIASYIYTADSATSRGTGWLDRHGSEPWDRDFVLVIAVRDLEFWKNPLVIEKLTETLGFLSNDRYTFKFTQLKQDRQIQQYFEFSDQDVWPFSGVDRVIMFSGGLDSLAGTLETASVGKKLVLVSHRPVAKLSTRQTDLFMSLKQKFAVPMIHIPVWINKEKGLGKEYTQRTRSFLYCALGTIVAQSIKAEGVRFYENGIVSLNWPIADEVLRARASRTTHPQTLHQFTEICSLITERDFIIDNPYLYKTKTEVVSSIHEKHGDDLINLTCSCVRTGLFQSKTQWHCGTCSQCIDRRIAILANGLEDKDPSVDYVSDVFTGPRKEGYEKNMAVNYVRHAKELRLMSGEEIAAKFNLYLSRAIRYLPQRSTAAHQFIEMHKRHSDTVHQVLVAQFQKNASALIEGTLDRTSMLSIVAGMQHLESSWKRFSNRIIELLKLGLPTACRTHKPANEPHLQEIADGILKGHDLDLIREFPFMRWSSSLTKPDWSSEELKLWVETKYVKAKKNIYRITEEISSDITKYSDNNRRVLFIIYDPSNFITDKIHFIEPITKRENMYVAFIH